MLGQQHYQQDVEWNDESSDENSSEIANEKQNQSSEDPSRYQTNSFETGPSRTRVTEIKKNQKVAYLPKDNDYKSRRIQNPVKQLRWNDLQK